MPPSSSRIRFCTSTRLGELGALDGCQSRIQKCVRQIENAGRSQLHAVCTSTAGALDEWDAHESGDGIESGVEGRNRAYASFLLQNIGVEDALSHRRGARSLRERLRAGAVRRGTYPGHLPGVVQPPPHPLVDRRCDHGDDKLEGQRKHRGQPARSDLQIQAANLREFMRGFWR